MTELKVLTVPSASDRYGVPRQTLYSAVHEGRLEAKRAGATWLIRESDIEEFLDRYRPRRQP